MSPILQMGKVSDLSEVTKQASGRAVAPGGSNNIRTFYLLDTNMFPITPTTPKMYFTSITMLPLNITKWKMCMVEKPEE